jgi:hypothetical protein
MPLKKRERPSITGNDLKRINKKIRDNNKSHQEKAAKLIKKYIENSNR